MHTKLEILRTRSKKGCGLATFKTLWYNVQIEHQSKDTVEGLPSSSSSVIRLTIAPPTSPIVSATDDVMLSTVSATDDVIVSTVSETVSTSADTDSPADSTVSVIWPTQSDVSRFAWFNRVQERSGVEIARYVLVWLRS